MTSRAELRRTLTVLIPLVVVTLLGGCQTQQSSSSFELANNGGDVEPLVAHSRRLIEATDLLGVPFSPAERRALEAAFQEASACSTPIVW